MATEAYENATKPIVPVPPGSYFARWGKYLRALWWALSKTDALGLIRDCFAEARKLKELPNKSGEVAVITGAGKGIGLEVLRKLLQCDYKVIIGIRDVKVGERVVKEIRENGVMSGTTVLYNLDLKSLNSVRKFASNVLKAAPRIDLLINNAGIMLAPFEETEDGFESHFQVNYLGHFLLTNLLLERIKNTSLKRKTSCRIVNVSSAAHFVADLDFTDLEKSKVYISGQAYADSKFAQVLHAKYLSYKLEEGNFNIKVYSLHPGVIYSNLWGYLGIIINWMGSSLQNLIKKPEDGANVVMYTALSKDLENYGGSYIHNCKRSKSHPKTKDKNLQALLWDRSIQLCETSVQIQNENLPE